MRILFLSNWLPPVLAGSAYYTRSLTRALHARGHELGIVTLQWEASEWPEEDFPFPVFKLPVIKLPRLALFYHLKRMGLAWTPANYRRLCSIVQEFRPELLHLVNHIFDTNLLATQVARHLGIPIVGSITTPIQHENPGVQRIFTWADRVTVGWGGVQKWDAIVSLDATGHDYAGKVYGRETQKKSVIIPFGVPEESFTLCGPSSPQRDGRPQILLVGHLHPFRNPTQLIRAMPYVLKEIPQARLVLAGRVDLEEPVKRARQWGLSQEAVTFLGETPHEEAVHWMKRSHVFASWVTGPYRGLGTAPLEAMLCETPVISDIPENLFGEGKLKNGENIVLVNSKDPSSIAEAICRLLQDEPLRQRIGSEGRRFVLEHLSWDRIAQDVEQFYEEVLRRRGGKKRLRKRAEPQEEPVAR